MGNRQVSVSIRAAFDSGFRSTFMTADQRVRALDASLKSMRQTAGEMKGLRQIRENLTGLNTTLQKQKSDLEKVTAAKERAIAAEKNLSDLVKRSVVVLAQAEAEHRRMREELQRESVAVRESLKPTTERIEALGRMKAAVHQAREEQARANREFAKAGSSLQGQKNHIEHANSRIRENANLLDSAITASGKATSHYKLLSTEYQAVRHAAQQVKQPTLEQAAALAALKEQTQAAKRAMNEADREVIRLTRALEADKQKALEAAGSLGIYETRLETAKATVADAAANYERLNQALTRQKQAMAAGPTVQQTAALEALEKSVEGAAETVRQAKTSLNDATQAHKGHQKAARENKETAEQLSRKEQDLTDSISATETQIKKATSASGEYSKSLEKQGHEVADLDKAEEKHLATMHKIQRTRIRDESSRALAERARDLRSQAQTSLMFTMGYGYLFTKPIREAMEFEKAMIRVKAMSAATDDEFKRLTADAKRLGAETIYTALEVAQAQNELATAGFRPDSIIAVMPHMLDLANSSMTGLARTAEITSEVLQGFNLDVSEMKRVGDSLTAAYSGSASSLDSLGEMLKYVSSIAVDVNSSLEQTLAASSVLHNNGIKGSMAGTGMRALFLRLSDPPAKLRKMFKEMDVAFKDHAGNMRNWAEILDDVNVRLEGAGSAVKARAYKVLGGEEHATTVSKLAAARKSGAHQLETKKIEMAPAFDDVASKLLKMPDTQIQQVGQALGVKFNRAMSGGGMVATLAGTLKGLKGKEQDAQMQKILGQMHLAPSLADAKAEEYRDQGKVTADALRRLHIDPKRRAGGMKDNLQLTTEIRTQLQTLPMEEQLKYIDIFFSRTRHGVSRLLQELSPGGQYVAEMIEGLNETLTMEKTRIALSKGASKALDEILGAFNAIIVSLGESLLPLFRDLMVSVKPYIDSFAKWIDTHQGAARAIMFAVGALLAFNATVGMIRFGLSGIVSTWAAGKRVKEFFGKDSLGGKALRVAGKGFRSVGKGLGWLKSKSMRGIGKVIDSGLIGLWNLVEKGPAIMSSLGAIMNVIRGIGLALVTTPIGLFISALVIGAILIWRNWGTVGRWLKKTWAQLEVFFVGLWKRVVPVTKAAWDFIKTYMAWHPVVYIAKHWEELVDFFKDIYKRIAPYIKWLFPTMDSDIKIAGPDDGPGFWSRMIDGSKEGFSNLFSSGAPEVETPAMPAAEKVAGKGSYTQRNVITVHADIHVDAGSAAPAQVASKIKGEIQSAFRNVPSFSFIDPVMVG